MRDKKSNTFYYLMVMGLILLGAILNALLIYQRFVLALIVLLIMPIFVFGGAALHDEWGD